jgi:hypothetical protein
LIANCCAWYAAVKMLSVLNPLNATYIFVFVLSCEEEKQQRRIPELSPRPRRAAFASRVVRAPLFDRLDTLLHSALSVCPLRLCAHARASSDSFKNKESVSLKESHKIRERTNANKEEKKKKKTTSVRFNSIKTSCRNTYRTDGHIE